MQEIRIPGPKTTGRSPSIALLFDRKWHFAVTLRLYVPRLSVANLVENDSFANLLSSMREKKEFLRMS